MGVSAKLNVRSPRPILRWAGGKYALVNDLSSLLPKKWGKYIEPMVGGGALFFHLKPKSAVLGDVNEELINFYSVLKGNPKEVKGRLLRLVPSKRTYYRMRRIHPRGKIQRAIRFAYLNRLCWNGLYRVNRQGHFNVPIGDRIPKIPFDGLAILAASKALRRAKLVIGSFDSTLKLATRGDFVFLDPPYPRGSKEKLGFNRYSSEIFTSDYHRQLAKSIEDLTRRGVKVMLVISGLNVLKNVYPSDLKRTVLRSKSLISCTDNGRKLVREVVMTNY